MRDDLHAYKRRDISNRLNEAYVKYIGFKMVKMPFRYYIYIARPIVMLVLQRFLYKRFHQRRISN